MCINKTKKHMSKPTDSIPDPPIENILANADTRDKFCDLFEECLDAMAGVFPECKKTEYLLNHYRDKVKNNTKERETLIKKWHRAIYPFYEIADNQDEDLWEKPLYYLGEIDIPSKWKDPGFTDEHKDVLWMYIKGLNKHSRFYNAIPNNMLGQIYSAATDLYGKYQTGEMKVDIDNLNLGEVKNIGQSLMDKIDQNDLHEFVNNLTGLAQSMDIQGIHDIPRVLSEVGMPGMQNHEQFTEILNQIFNSGPAQGMAEEVAVHHHHADQH